jgi:nanoRNase/pAp phosphatase (c-di-AMP/oligoRNAs hydrolase)
MTRFAALSVAPPKPIQLLIYGMLVDTNTFTQQQIQLKEFLYLLALAENKVYFAHNGRLERPNRLTDCTTLRHNAAAQQSVVRV